MKNLIHYTHIASHQLVKMTLALLLVLSLGSGLALATTLIPKNLDDLTKDAESIFTGTVVNVRSEWSADQKTIYTYVTFGDVSPIKGEESGLVELRFEGGTVGETTISVSEVPEFEVNQRVLLFTRGNGRALCPLVGWSQGYFRLEQDDNGREMVMDSNARPVLGIRNSELIKGESLLDARSEGRISDGTTEIGQPSQLRRSKQRQALRQALSAEEFIINIQQLSDRLKLNQKGTDQNQHDFLALPAPAEDDTKPAPPPNAELSSPTSGERSNSSGPLSLLASLPVGLAGLAFLSSRSRFSSRKSGRRVGLKHFIGLCLVVGLGAVSAFPFAYRTSDGAPVIWPSKSLVFDLHPVSFPEGSTWNLNAQYAMSDWNAITGSAFRFYVRTRATDYTNHNNGINSVVFLRGSNFDSGVLATTFHTASGRNITDKDVWFNVDQPWVPGLDADSTPPSSNFSFRGVARHEYGHALGLRHEDRNIVATMNSIYSFGANAQGFHADDMAAVRFLYPAVGSERDLYASNWVKRSDSNSQPATLVASLPGHIRRGQSLTLEYSFGNRGNLNSGSFEIGFYLSTNSIISTGDRLLGYNVGAFADAGFFGTFTRTLTIPSDVAPGTYYLGVLLDRTNVVPESQEGNNALAHYQAIIVDP